MYRPLAVPCHVWVIIEYQRREPLETRGAHVLASREKGMGRWVIVQVLAVNCISDADEVLQVSQGRRLQLPERAKLREGAMSSRPIYVCCQAGQGCYKNPGGCHPLALTRCRGCDGSSAAVEMDGTAELTYMSMAIPPVNASHLASDEGRAAAASRRYHVTFRSSPFWS